jgi:hypothetical protein
VVADAYSNALLFYSTTLAFAVIDPQPTLAMPIDLSPLLRKMSSMCLASAGPTQSVAASSTATANSKPRTRSKPFSYFSASPEWLAPNIPFSSRRVKMSSHHQVMQQRPYNSSIVED